MKTKAEYYNSLISSPKLDTLYDNYIQECFDEGLRKLNKTPIKHISECCNRYYRSHFHFQNIGRKLKDLQYSESSYAAERKEAYKLILKVWEHYNK